MRGGAVIKEKISHLVVNSIVIAGENTSSIRAVFKCIKNVLLGYVIYENV